MPSGKRFDPVAQGLNLTRGVRVSGIAKNLDVRRQYQQPVPRRAE